MKNTLTDLNNYLFEQIERLNDDELSEDQLEKEIKRSEAVQKVARTIIENGQLALSAKKAYGRIWARAECRITYAGHNQIMNRSRKQGFERYCEKLTRKDQKVRGVLMYENF